MISILLKNGNPAILFAGIICGCFAVFFVMQSLDNPKSICKKLVITPILFFIGQVIRQYWSRNYKGSFDPYVFQSINIFLFGAGFAFTIVCILMYFKYIKNRINSLNDKSNTKFKFSFGDILLFGNNFWKIWPEIFVKNEVPNNLSSSDEGKGDPINNVTLNYDYSSFIRDIVIESRNVNSSSLNSEQIFDSKKAKNIFYRFLCESTKRLFDSNCIRATVFEYNSENEAMEMARCSEQIPPSSISLIAGNNLVQKSMDMDAPVKYSDYPQYHKNSDDIKRGHYDDCYLVCAVVKNGKPFIAFSIEVRGLEATLLMDHYKKQGMMHEIKFALLEKVSYIDVMSATHAQRKKAT